MYRTELNVNGKTIPVKFGAYVMKLIADEGIKLSEISERLQSNPADSLPKIIYYGAVNASPDRKGENISINDIYDWIDEQPGGLFGKTVMDVLNLFTSQMTDGVPSVKEKASAGAKKK
jgi:hypothetical protein